MVSQDWPASDRVHSALSWGTTAEAENHRAMAKSSPSANRNRLRHFSLSMEPSLAEGAERAAGWRAWRARSL